MNGDTVQVLTEEELQLLILNFMHGRGDAGGTQEEMAAVYSWAAQARIDATTLDLVLKMQIGIDVQGGEILFRGMGERKETAG